MRKSGGITDAKKPGSVFWLSPSIEANQIGFELHRTPLAIWSIARTARRARWEARQFRSAPAVALESKKQPEWKIFAIQWL